MNKRSSSRARAMKRSKVCKETSDTLTLGTCRDEARAERAAFHLERCADCQQDEAIVAAMRETVLSADDQLDDLTRARVGDKLGASMEQAAAKAGAAPLWHRRGVQLAAVAACLALVTGLLLWQASRRPAEAPRQSAVAKHQPGHRVILPRAIVQGSGPWHDPKLVFGQKVERLAVPAGVALRASLTERAELTLYGPLALVVKQAAGDRIELQLDSGILIGEYKGSKGSSLVIRSPGAVTEIVGTLFAVEAHEGQSRVSVSRGTVRVQSAGKTTAVSRRQSWSTARSRLGATPPSVVALFAKHERLPELAQVRAAEPEGAAQGERPAPKTKRAAAQRKPRVRRAAPVAVAPVAVAPVALKQPAASAVAEQPKPTVSPAEQPKTAEQPAQPHAQPHAQPPTPQSASVLYSAAEAALKQRQHDKAEQSLSVLIKAHPRHTLADAARYDLALLLLKRGARTRAEPLLRQIPSTARFAGPAHYLRCRIKREQGKRAAAIACYSAFRSAYPASPYAYQALVTLMRLAAAHKDCERVKRLTGEYLSDYDVGKHVEEARRLRARCGK
jgi:TolA-binding protein